MTLSLRLLLCTATAALPLSGCQVSGEEQAMAQSPNARPRYSVTAVGRIDSMHEARNLVASVDGVIDAVHISRGDAVRAGQQLMTIDCGPRRSSERASAARAAEASAAARTVAQGSRQEDILAAQQQVAIARAARDEAADRLAQAEALAPRGFVAQRELTARRHAMQAAEAELAAAGFAASRIAAGPMQSERMAANAAASAARADAQTAQTLSDQCRLTSPIDGRVLQILRREGEFSGASQGSVLAIVGDLSQAMVRAEISDRNAAAVQSGQRADIWIEGEPRRWRARVSELASVMGRRSARSLDPTDRFDRDVREALLVFDGDAPPVIVGLRVMVGFHP
jgi:HlyD family secretion protein